MADTAGNLTLQFNCAILILSCSTVGSATYPVKELNSKRMERHIMERIKTLETRNLCESAKNGGCGECQTSCQSACKTSCGVANQKCENSEK